MVFDIESLALVSRGSLKKCLLIDGISKVPGAISFSMKFNWYFFLKVGLILSVESSSMVGKKV